MEYNDFVNKYFDPEDSASGFNEMLFERQAHLKQLRSRLQKYYLTDQEIDELFKIITNAELEMEKIKRKYSFGKNIEKEVVDMSDKLVLIQKRMQLEFEAALSKKIKQKYENAKKIVKKMEKENPFNK